METNTAVPDKSNCQLRVDWGERGAVASPRAGKSSLDFDDLFEIARLFIVVFRSAKEPCNATFA